MYIVDSGASLHTMGFEDYSTVKQNSGYSDRQWHCGLSHASNDLHQGAWPYLWVQLVQCFRWEDHAMNLVVLFRGRQDKLPGYQRV